MKNSNEKIKRKKTIFQGRKTVMNNKQTENSNKCMKRKLE